ncbi:MAG: ABC-2 family transporter protein [Chloroflexi bacterium]|nr:ABC-2 family transporter protein [Chloroflexota bacterium]
MRRYIDFYLASMKISILEQIQYSMANYFYMIGMITEPVIYLVVWTTIANQQGGTAGGYTAGGFAAYYIIWTLVRNMNIVFTPYGWEWRIREGRLSMELMRPIHPIHGDVAFFAGWKFVVILLWLPLAAILTWIFKPTFHITWMEALVFFLAIWGAYLIRTILLSLLGMITFWTTRVSAIFELYFGLELILSGRLVPMTLMPLWVQNLSNYLPFKWTFFFPIETLVGTMTTSQLWSGVGMQLLWIVSGIIILNIIWNFAVRQYSAVGG